MSTCSWPCAAGSLALIVALATGCGGASDPHYASPEHGTVTRVVDGDTVDVALSAGGTVRVRVLGIDTPEVHGGAECWGPEASQFAREQLAGRVVTLQRDHTQGDTDRFGRVLRYIIHNGGNYSIEAAAAGAAEAYVYRDRPVRLHEQITAAQQRARQAGRGLWGACPS